MIRLNRLAAAPIIALSIGCAAVTATDPADRILGTWNGQEGRAAGTSMEFDSDGSATWTIGGEEYRLTYRYSALGSRHHVDLAGFTAGPLAGRTLYCLGQMPDEDTLRLDCEPGNDPSARPATIDDAQVQIFRRE